MNSDQREKAEVMLAEVNKLTTRIVGFVNEDIKAAMERGEEVNVSVLTLALLTSAATYARAAGMPIDNLHAGVSLAYAQTIPMDEVPAAMGGGKLDG